MYSSLVCLHALVDVHALIVRGLPYTRSCVSTTAVVQFLLALKLLPLSSAHRNLRDVCVVNYRVATLFSRASECPVWLCSYGFGLCLPLPLEEHAKYIQNYLFFFLSAE